MSALKTGFSNPTSWSRIVQRGTTGAKADDVFCQIADQFYVRFQKEDVIDVRMKEAFSQNIPNAPPLTEGEQKLLDESVLMVEDISTKAKRVAGTVNESVEKFLYRADGGGAAVAMTVAKMDVAAVTLLTEVSDSEGQTTTRRTKIKCGSQISSVEFVASPLATKQ